MANHYGRADAGLNLIIYPSNLVGAGRVGKIAKTLQDSGNFGATHAVGMYIAQEGLPQEEVLSPGVLVKRIRIENYRSVAARAFAQLVLWPRRVVRAYAKQNVRVVAAQRAGALPTAYYIARKTGALLAYNAHELETEILGFTGIKQKLFKAIERRYIKHVEVISVVNESIADWYTNEYPSIPQPVVLTNTPIDDGHSIDMRAKLGIPDGELLYVHVGYIAPGRNVPLILEAFAVNPQVHVVFLGDGDLRHLVEEAALMHPNIHWHPMVEPDEVVAHVRGADIGLCLIERASLSDELSTPNKLLESWVAGIPPLCSGLQEARRLLGPHLTDTWVLKSPERQLSDALERITTDDVAKFRKHWTPVPTWDFQAIGLVHAYEAAIAAHAKVSAPAIQTKLVDFRP